MANIKSQIKRAITNEKARQRNVHIKSATRTAIKKAKIAITSNETNMQETLNHAISMLDRAESKNIFHKNKVARIKSKLTIKANNIKETN
ncbi:30S ribosomal protein S20 [Spiroplasma endosymbiont of 'Nebria riversi']|uniref:30S ribosomal protein S20 n=1 Tax=Spiroplasma endosymbiont of 'Nebria riversi' TaxID=2792084 RepID=UPI001C041630|nr:30S ribosomal protein S20 [Spiroplasma endosymbiont of 'Nebria riversi']